VDGVETGWEWDEMDVGWDGMGRRDGINDLDMIDASGWVDVDNF